MEARKRRRCKLLTSAMVAVSAFSASDALLSPDTTIGRNNLISEATTQRTIKGLLEDPHSRVRQTMVLKTNMFLKHDKIEIASIRSSGDHASSTIRHPISNVKLLQVMDESNVHHRARNRGVLGFSVFDFSMEGPSQSSSSKLEVWSSKVDYKEWAAGEDLSDRPRASNPILNRSPTTSLHASPSPLWFPWIPTYSQINALKVSELRQVCLERGLKQTGDKKTLQIRLMEWTKEKQQKRLFIGGDNAFTFPNLLEDSELNLPAKPQMTNGTEVSAIEPRIKPEAHLKASSLDEWTRTFNIETLQKRREQIHKEKREGKVVVKESSRPMEEVRSTREKRSTLAKLFRASSSQYSNVEVKKMYDAAKHADQNGDRKLAKVILHKLKQATPNDARIFRRLARMETEEGKINNARAILQEGIRLHPQNAHLVHGLGLLEQKAGSDEEARSCFRKAISIDPSFPNAFHALGTLEHTQGRIAVAMKTIKQGLRYSPSNHRLHHALGDLYREAKVLNMAERSYRRALEVGPGVSRCFAYTALAHVAYEKESVDKCRSWLRKALAINDGRHAKGWVSLSQLEESEGNIEGARSVCVAALAQYEAGLIKRHMKRLKKENEERRGSSWLKKIGQNPAALKEELLKSVPRYRSGDNFIHVYRNWIRLEERYGTLETVNDVYQRASISFPNEWRLTVGWAQYQAKLYLHSRARELFAEACEKAGSRHADPYRLYAEFEMSLGNYHDARKILYRGALAMSRSSDGGFGSRCGMAEMFLTWAICEWHLEELSRAEVLFDHALRLSNAGDEGSQLRSFIFYAIASLEYEREEYHLAQHCIGLCLKENLMPGGNSQIWELWADVATDLGNEDLAAECAAQSQLESKQENDGVVGLSRLLALEDPGASSSGLSRMKGPDMQSIMRREPWQYKLFHSEHAATTFFRSVRLPER